MSEGTKAITEERGSKIVICILIIWIVGFGVAILRLVLALRLLISLQQIRSVILCAWGSLMNFQVSTGRILEVNMIVEGQRHIRNRSHVITRILLFKVVAQAFNGEILATFLFSRRGLL